jgi:hypothetical protein
MLVIHLFRFYLEERLLFNDAGRAVQFTCQCVSKKIPSSLSCDGISSEEEMQFSDVASLIMSD